AEPLEQGRLAFAKRAPGGRRRAHSSQSSASSSSSSSRSSRASSTSSRSSSSSSSSSNSSGSSDATRRRLPQESQSEGPPISISSRSSSSISSSASHSGQVAIRSPRFQAPAALAARRISSEVDYSDRFETVVKQVDGQRARSRRRLLAVTRSDAPVSASTAIQ